MTPSPSNPCFRHEPEVGSCYGGAMQSKPISTDPNGCGSAKALAVEPERSIAGRRNDIVSGKQPVGGRVVKFLLPPKKRAMSDSSSDYHSDADDGSFVLPPKKRRAADTGSDGTSRAYVIPARTHEYDTEMACGTAARPKPSNSKAIAVVPSRPPPRQHKKKKLMHDGIRSGGVAAPWRDFGAYDEYMEEAETSAAGAARAKKKTNRNKGKSNGPRLPAWEPIAPDDRTLRPSEALGRHLETLGATASPRFVCMKALSDSDVTKNQNRLLFSCKREFVEDHAITRIYAGNEKETYLVNQCGTGLRVRTFDGRGREYGIRLKYLGSNGGYRLITGWHAFVEANGLDVAVAKKRRVDLELWEFRSPRLPGQPPLLKDKEKLDKDSLKDRQEIVDGLQDHPDGALGLLFIPYIDGVDISNVVHGAEGEMAQEEMAEEEEEREDRAPPAAVHETKRQASAKAVREEKRAREEKRIADRARANRGKAVAREMTIEEVIEEAGEELAGPLIGLLTLSSYFCSSINVPTPTLDNTHRSGTTM